MNLYIFNAKDMQIGYILMEIWLNLRYVKKDQKLILMVNIGYKVF